MLLPVIGIIQVNLQEHADRYTYLPQIGLYLIIAWGVADLLASWRYRTQIASAAAVVVILAFAFAARVQASYWRDSETRSEEHTSELQSHLNLVCRLLLEKKKNT